MTEFSCSVQVTDVQTNAGYGAVAKIVFVQPSVGIDVSPVGEVQIEITEDSAEIVQKGKFLRFTLSDQDPVPPGSTPAPWGEVE